MPVLFPLLYRCTVRSLRVRTFPNPCPLRWLNKTPLQELLMGPAVCWRYVHHRAGVAALFTAFPDKKSAVSLPSQQVLSFVSVAAPDIPCLLVVVGQILIIFHQRILAEEQESRLLSEVHGNHQPAPLFLPPLHLVSAPPTRTPITGLTQPEALWPEFFSHPVTPSM